MTDTTPGFVPGYLGTITIDNQNVSAVLHVTNWDESRNGLGKAVFGTEDMYTIGGKFSFAVGAEGSVEPASYAGLRAAFRKQARIPFSTQLGQAGTPTDGGLYEGFVVLTQFNTTGNADGQWQVTIAGTGSGAPSYEPAGS